MAATRHIYWANQGGGTIHKAELDGSNITEIQTAVGTPKICDLHEGSGHLYYTDSVGAKVSRCDIDGSNTVVLVSGGVTGKYQGVAVDETNDKFYITSSAPNGSERVARYDLDGLNETVILSGVMMDAPVGIDLDVPNDRIYWADYTAQLVGWATLNGASSGIAVGNINQMGWVTFNRDDNKLYLGTATTIQRADTDGANLEVLISGLGDIRGIGVDPSTSKIYYTEYDYGTIHRCDLDGSNIETIISGQTLQGPQGITIYMGPATSGINDQFNLYIEGSGDVVVTPSGEPLRIIHRLVKTGDYDPQLIGTFETPPTTVNIEIWDIVDGQNIQVTITNSGCYTIGNTGRWGWSTVYLPFTEERQKYHYYYQMTSNEGENVYGEFFITVPEHGLWSHP